MQVKELLNDCHAAIGEIRRLRGQIDGLLERLKTNKLWLPEFKKQAESFKADLTELENRLIQTKSESRQDPINYPPMLDDQIAYLYSIVNAQDDRPNAGAYRRYADLRQLFAAEKKQLTQWKSERVPVLNKLLNEADLQMIQSK